MTAAVRIAGFAALLALIFAASTLVGAELDPSVDETDADHQAETETMNGHATTITKTAQVEGHAEANGSGAVGPPGLAVAQDGYRLVPDETTVDSGPAVNYAFRIIDENGATVRDFELEHERRMHLIVIRRDFEHFQHLHPRQLEDGSWEADVDLSQAGVYRVFADFASGGQSLTLASDLFVPGRFDPVPLPPPASTDDAGDGYEVSLDSASPRGGGANQVRFTVRRSGRELDSVEPYLGADGHLVALRENDQAFLHTHPDGEPGGSGPISFQVEYPSAGRYRLFLQFKHQGKVRIASFTQQVDGVNAEAVVEKASKAGGHAEDANHGH